MVARWLTAIASVALLSCQAIAGLNEDRPLALACAVGAARCNAGSVERCDGQAWHVVEECSAACVGGECKGLQITAGHFHTCMRRDDASVSCWGMNEDAQLGVAQTMPCKMQRPCRPAPGVVPGISQARMVSSLSNFSCAVEGMGVKCWGDNSFGQLGVPASSDPVTTPVEPAFPTDIGPVVQVSAGGGQSVGVGAAHTCALTESGAVYCWGANCAGQLGFGSATSGDCPTGGLAVCSTLDAPTNVSRPTRVSLPFAAAQVAAGGAHTCALSVAGDVWCWGLNYQQQAGVPDTFENQCVPPTQVPGVRRAVQLVAGGLYSCALLDDGTVDCWGRPENGVLGEPVSEASRGPAPVPGVAGAVEIAAGHGTHVCARLRDGELVCWGENANAELGRIDQFDADGVHVLPKSLSASPVAGIPTTANVALGGNHTCSIATNREVWCWGETAFGATGTLPGLPIEPARVGQF